MQLSLIYIDFTFFIYHVNKLVHTCLLLAIEKSSEAITQSNSVDHSHMDTNPCNLDVGSVIEYDQNCGVIKWIGKLPDHTEVMAGLEMVKHVTI